MPRILCKLPNASEVINGVQFEKTEGGMLSKVVSDAEAAQFERIAGYTVIPDKAVRPASKSAD